MLSDEDKVLIRCLRESKKYDAKRLLKVFADRLWNLGGLQKLVRKIDETDRLAAYLLLSRKHLIRTFYLHQKHFRT